MIRKGILYAAGLIALYLVVKNYSGAAKVESAGASGVSNVTKAFQGR